MEKINLIQESHIAQIDRRNGGYEVSEILFDGDPAVFEKRGVIVGHRAELEVYILKKLADGSGEEAQTW